ncbi:MAG: helix-turn-helix domain-containing protein [Planctomycetes bacterium]|nr:helix-turn-helix domain-containing protein [Planctomycetota bacterium]
MTTSLIASLAQELIAEPPLLPVSRAAELAGVTKRNIHRWIADGRLKAAKTHPDAGRGRTLILKSSLLALLGGDA